MAVDRGMKRWPRAATEIAVLAAIGLFLGAIGPFDTYLNPVERRLAYWQCCIIGGGAIGIAVDAVLMQWIRGRWIRLLATSAAMTPPVTLYVQLTAMAILQYRPPRLDVYVELLWQVFVISVPVMAVRMLATYRPAPAIETRTLIEPPLPEAEAVFCRRLSAKRRVARLIAVQADDHYLQVHTDAGTELVAMRFADALTELERAHGYRVHRSWWVAADAIELVRWQRGSGELRLAGELTVPVSRSYAATLKELGWR